MQVDNFDPLFQVKEEKLVLKRQDIDKLEAKFNKIAPPHMQMKGSIVSNSTQQRVEAEDGVNSGSPKRRAEYDMGLDDNQPNDDMNVTVTDD